MLVAFALLSPTVMVGKPIKKQIVEWDSTAQTQAVDKVTITPRVTAYIDSISLKEGGIVNTGDLLYVIDPPLLSSIGLGKGELEKALGQLVAG